MLYLEQHIVILHHVRAELRRLEMDAFGGNREHCKFAPKALHLVPFEPHWLAWLYNLV
jgi:hypothetical protein